ncbi:MAG: hypothetical protein J5646_06120 [Bacteroidales bacterium]|nr:hypothetical protein [Bacteroidales bacterium]
MKKLLLITLLLLPLSAFAQNNPIDKALSRFTDPDNPDYAAFLAKGGNSFGISGSYRLFNVDGEKPGDGYSILSLLNIGEGRLQTWSVAPSYSWFVADDLSLGVSLNYNGYLIDTNIKLDFRDILGSDDEDLNIQLSNRHMLHHKVGAGFTARRYKSLFGSKMLGVFAEGRLFGAYGVTYSHPIPKDGGEVKKHRVSGTISLGLDVAGGLAVRLKDNSVLTLSIPIVGVGWQHSHQNKYWTTKDAEGGKATGGSAKMDRFSIARNIDATGIQVGYVRYILPKKK